MGRKIVAIDPGLTGALAFFDGDTPYRLTDMPIMARSAGRGQQVNGYELFSLLSVEKPEYCYLENVSARPGQGVSSMFRFGEGYGIVQGVLASLRVPMQFITPVIWKKRMGLINKDKDMARTMAIQMFPQFAGELKRKKDIGRADALLIGLAAINK